MELDINAVLNFESQSDGIHGNNQDVRSTEAAVYEESTVASKSNSTIAHLGGVRIDTLQLQEDDVSTVGSGAPTLAKKDTMNSHDDDKTISTRMKEKYVVGDKENEEDDISSVGSDAPTIRTKSTSISVKKKYIEAIKSQIDDVSSVGSGAPTLATETTAKTMFTTAIMENKYVNADIKGDGKDDLSTLGSNAPTLKRLRHQSSFRAEFQEQYGQDSQDDLACSRRSGATFDHVNKSDLDILGGFLGRELCSSGLENAVGKFLRQGSLVALSLWIVLLGVFFGVAPCDSYQYLGGMERNANILLLILLIKTNITRLGPFLVLDKDKSFLNSGVLTANMVVQVIAISSATLMLVFPTPVLVDPIVGIRSHLVRWAEWTALAFLMTFLTESIDLPLEDGSALNSWIVGVTVAFSTVCGAIFPFCPDLRTWLVVFCIAWILFCALFVRLFQRGLRLWNMKPGDTAMEKEDYERAKYAFKLMSICTCLWTILALGWSLCCLAPKYATPGSIWTSEWIVFVIENIFEGLSKMGYVTILLEIHYKLFDEAAKTSQRIGELRNYMSAVWDFSTDTAVICARHDHVLNAVISPAFFSMETSSSTPPNTRRPVTLIMEVDPYDGSHWTFEVDLSRPIDKREAEKMYMNQQKKARMVTPIFQKNVKILADLVCDAYTCGVQEGATHGQLTRDFYSLDEDNNERILSHKAKVVRLNRKAIVFTLSEVV